MRAAGKHFERKFKLPPEADIDHVGATFKTGVFEVHVPKSERADVRKIETGA
ncbi:MAG: Hsp20/alpha crystallin family protein [Gaiellaceae bacterium]